jgi:hypothetical protein
MGIVAHIIGEPEEESSWVPEFLIFRAWCVLNTKELREMIGR